MQIARKVLLLLGTSVFGTLLVTTTLELRSFNQQFRHENEELHTTILANLMQNLNGALFNFDKTRLINQISAAFEFGSIRKIIVIDEYGKVVVAFEAGQDPNSPEQLPQDSHIQLPPFAFDKAILPYDKAALKMIRKVQDHENTLLAALWHLEGEEKTFVGHALLIFDASKAEIALQKEIGHKLASALVLAIVIFGLSYLLIRSLVIGKLLVLKKSALEIKKRNYSVKLPVSKGDEVGELAEAFHEMIEEIKAYQSNLEERVRDKTRDIRSILDTTPIGIFSFGKDLLVHSDYALHLESIFEEDNLAGRTIQELLLKRSQLSHDDEQRVLAAILYSMGQDDIVFEANAPNLPRELEIKTQSRTKFLDIDWSPMYNDKGLIDKILVSVRDITEHLRLKKDADSSKQNLQRLGEILAVGPEAYQRFIADYQDIFNEIQSYLSESKDAFSRKDVEPIYVLIHTLKGYARFSHFQSIAEACHEVESVLHWEGSQNHILGENLKYHISKIQSTIQLYEESFTPILNLRTLPAKTSTPSDSRITEQSLTPLLREMDEVADSLARELGKGGYIIRKDLQGRDQVSVEFYKTLSRCLVHLIRNAVDHGLESIEERKSKGKDPKGVLRIYWQDDYLCLKDDGRGIDLNRIRDKARSLGKTVPEGHSSLANLIFEDGFSTAAMASQISGRGVGMGAIRRFLAEVDCQIEIIPDKIRKENERDFLEFHFRIKVPQRHETTHNLLHAI